MAHPCTKCGHASHDGVTCRVLLGAAGAPGSGNALICDCGSPLIPPSDLEMAMRLMEREDLEARAVEVTESRAVIAERLQSTVAQSEHFQSELRVAEIAIAVLTRERAMALAEVKRQEEVINGTAAKRVLELLAKLHPVEANPRRVTFKLQDWREIFEAIESLRP